VTIRIESENPQKVTSTWTLPDTSKLEALLKSFLA